MIELIPKARNFAAKAHVGQLRKYDAAPYIIHPYRISLAVARLTADTEMEVAALLHDTVEDTPVTLIEIEREFGQRVRGMVEDVTDVTTLADGNRKTRKAIERDRLAGVSPDSQTLKLGDIIDNLRDIETTDPKFAPIYFAEKRELLEVLTKGHPAFYHEAMMTVESFFSRRRAA
jgi:(p)ppGpp synthase/HD superfamily hydrolase